MAAQQVLAVVTQQVRVVVLILPYWVGVRGGVMAEAPGRSTHDEEKRIRENTDGQHESNLTPRPY